MTAAPQQRRDHLSEGPYRARSPVAVRIIRPVRRMEGHGYEAHGDCHQPVRMWHPTSQTCPLLSCVLMSQAEKQIGEHELSEKDRQERLRRLQGLKDEENGKTD